MWQELVGIRRRGGGETGSLQRKSIGGPTALRTEGCISRGERAPCTRVRRGVWPKRSAESGVLPPRLSQAEGPFPETTLRHRVDQVVSPDPRPTPVGPRGGRRSTNRGCGLRHACPHEPGAGTSGEGLPGVCPVRGKPVRGELRRCCSQTCGASPCLPAIVRAPGDPSPGGAEERPAGRSGVVGRLHNPTADRTHLSTNCPDPPGTDTSVLCLASSHLSSASGCF